MNEININGEVYVKKSDIKIDSQVILNNLQEGKLQFYEVINGIKDYMKEELSDGDWFDGNQLLNNSSSEKLQMAMIYRLL